MNQDDADETDSLKSFYAYKNSFEKDSIWVKIPKRGEFLPQQQCGLYERLMRVRSSDLYHQP